MTELGFVRSPSISDFSIGGYFLFFSFFFFLSVDVNVVDSVMAYSPYIILYCSRFHFVVMTADLFFCTATRPLWNEKKNLQTNNRVLYILNGSTRHPFTDKEENWQVGELEDLMMEESVGQPREKGRVISLDLFFILTRTNVSRFVRSLNMGDERWIRLE